MNAYLEFTLFNVVLLVLFFVAMGVMQLWEMFMQLFKKKS